MSISQLIRLLISLAAAFFFYQAGQDMSDIKSVSGDSINEAFYQAMGTLSYGLAALSVVIGCPVFPRVEQSQASPMPGADGPTEKDDPSSSISEMPGH